MKSNVTYDAEKRGDEELKLETFTAIDNREIHERRSKNYDKILRGKARLGFKKTGKGEAY